MTHIFIIMEDLREISPEQTADPHTTPRGSDGPDRAVRLFSGTLSAAREFGEATRLYRRTFNYDLPQLSLNANLLSALGRHGGSSVGVRRDSPEGPLVGFAYGFAALDPQSHKLFHYSQAAVVDPSMQGRGIGRILKLRQAEVARSWGATHMRWGYNPLFARNAHFNLDSLRGVGRDFVVDYYGRPHSDRMIVEWDLRDGGDHYADQHEIPLPESLKDAEPATAVPGDDGVWIPIPSWIVAGDNSEEGAEAVRDTLRQTLSAVMASGLVLVSCRRLGSEMSVYRAVADRGGAL
jgi:predicted GNAT superfamily acetyltransferase